MRWQTTALLAVILVAVGAFYYVYEIRLGPEREKTAERKGRVFSADTTDVTEATLKRGAEVVRLKREGDGWQVLEPVRARGDKGEIESALTSVVMAKMDREIAAAPPSLADFGLDKPVAEVTLQLKDGKQLGLLLGSKSPTGVWVYARERDKPNVFVVGETVLRDTTRPIADFRDKTVLAFDRKDVTALEIVTRDESLALEPAGSQWKLTRPVALAADAETVIEFLDKLGSAKVKEFAAEAPPSLASFGLERPVRVSLHTGKDKERANKSLLFGRVEDKKGVYAMRAGETSVLLLPEDVWTALPRTVAAARNKTLVEVDRDKVTRVELTSPRGNVTLAREGNRWRITAPESVPADPVEAGAILSKVRELRAQAFITDDAAGIPRYLSTPEVRLSLTQEGAPAPITILLAPSPERRGGQPSAYAAVAGRGPVVLVEGKALADLGRSVTDLRDRTLLADLTPKDVRRLRVRAGGQSMLLERTGDTEWTVLEPARGAAKSGRVEDLLYALRALRWKEIAAPRGEEPARYGLDAPAFEVSLFRPDGTEIATVLIGKREGERAWVRTKASPAIYAVEGRQLGELPKIPDDLKG